jgi:hypothetical protein
LPEEIINITSKKYLEIYYLLTGIKIGWGGILEWI